MGMGRIDLVADRMDVGETVDLLETLVSGDPQGPYSGVVTGCMLLQLLCDLPRDDRAPALFAGLPHMRPDEVLALEPYWKDDDLPTDPSHYCHPPAVKAVALRKIARAFRERMPGACQLWREGSEADGSDSDRDWFWRKTGWEINEPRNGKWEWEKGDWAGHCAWDFDRLASCAEALDRHGVKLLQIRYHDWS